MHAYIHSLLEFMWNIIGSSTTNTLRLPIGITNGTYVEIKISCLPTYLSTSNIVIVPLTNNISYNGNSSSNAYSTIIGSNGGNRTYCKLMYSSDTTTWYVIDTN